MLPRIAHLALSTNGHANSSWALVPQLPIGFSLDDFAHSRGSATTNGLQYLLEGNSPKK